MLDGPGVYKITLKAKWFHKLLFTNEFSKIYPAYCNEVVVVGFLMYYIYQYDVVQDLRSPLPQFSINIKETIERENHSHT